MVLRGLEGRGEKAGGIEEGIVERAREMGGAVEERAGRRTACGGGLLIWTPGEVF